MQLTAEDCSTVAELSAAVTLASVLRLLPLDRLQILNRHTLAETSLCGDVRHELPFWFFQRLTSSGLIEVRSPSGSSIEIPPSDVCDVITGKPVAVMAMPQCVFLERLKLPYRNSPEPKCYAPAHVLYAQRSKYGCSFVVSFQDAKLDSSSCSFFSPLAAGEAERIRPLTTRRIMPIQEWRSTAPWSADAGRAAAETKAKRFVQKFFSDRVYANLA